jgi:two-component system nitrogen regulation response regulator GlnG/two-component system response regulator HydG
VESADQGTLFLDEVGELSLASQVKLLRFLQERTFRRVGDTYDRNINVRIIAASNRNLHDMVATKEFRLDLLYRLKVFNLHIPPLRERMQTLPTLVQFFAHRYNALYDKQVTRISADAERRLKSYKYPGNVRELENIIEHALVLTEGVEITSAHLPDFLLPEPLQISGPVERISHEHGFQTLEEMEKQHIIEALKLTGFNYGEAAKKLGVCRATLWRKIKIYGIEKN